jgi:hypothetical protein
VTLKNVLTFKEIEQKKHLLSSGGKKLYIDLVNGQWDYIN